jgi:hypothetical protein
MQLLQFEQFEPLTGRDHSLSIELLVACDEKWVES